MQVTLAENSNNDSVDENALFADTATITDSAGFASAKKPVPGEERKSVGFSGDVLTVGQLGADRSYWPDWDAAHSTLAAGAVGDAFIDARMLRGFRAYANLEWSYNAALPRSLKDTATAFRVPEMFLDANVGKKAYFRAGKQVLQWGRCFFFNPTDLINIERKSFFQRIGSREGVYGLKAHVPFGTQANLYGFVDAQGANRPDSLAGAAKAEFLIGPSEMAAMMWDKGGHDPVYGADLSTRALGLDISAEAALHQSFRSNSIVFTGGIPRIETERRNWVTRASLGVGRGFRVSGIQDRLTIEGEFYYNQAGTSAARLPFSGLAPVQPGAFPGSDALAALVAAGFYEPNSYSRRYAAFFATFNRFLRSDITLTFNGIGNLDQHCALLSGGISYRDLNDFSLTLLVNGFAGPARTEYTAAGQAAQLQLLAQADF